MVALFFRWEKLGFLCDELPHPAEKPPP